MAHCGNTTNLYLDHIQLLTECCNKNFPKEMKNKCYRRGVGEDGSCYYHTLAVISNFMNYNKKSNSEKIIIGRNLRRLLQKSLDKNWNRFWKSRNLQQYAPHVDKIRAKMQNYRIWADLWACYYSFNMLRCNVIFYDMDRGCLPYCGVTTKNSEKHLFTRIDCKDLPSLDNGLALIAWVKHSHFEPIGFWKHSPFAGGDRNIMNQPKPHELVFVFKNHLKWNLINNYETSAKCKNVGMREISNQNQ